MKHIVVLALMQYAAYVDAAQLHITGPDERELVFGDGTTAFATLSGGEGYVNSTVTISAPDFVTMTGTSLQNELMVQQAQIGAQQAQIVALLERVDTLSKLNRSGEVEAVPVHVNGTKSSVNERFAMLERQVNVLQEQMARLPGTTTWHPDGNWSGGLRAGDLVRFDGGAHDS